MNFDGIPEELKSPLGDYARNWTVWKKETRDGKPAKVPYQANGRRAKSNNPETWMPFSTAVAGYENLEGYNGICCMMPITPEGLIFIDLDKCVDDNGILEPWAMEIVKRFNSYTEKSQSGHGLHILIKGKKPFKRCRKNRSPIEVYDCLRPMYLTGDFLDVQSFGPSIESRQEEFEKFFGEIFGKEDQRPMSTQEEKEDEALIKLIKKSKQGHAFKELWKGSTKGYGGDESSADMALLDILAFWTHGNAAQMERMFSQSGLGKRDKWRNRPDYRERTIQKAISDATAFYEPQNTIPPHDSVDSEGRAIIVVTEEELRDMSAISIKALAEKQKDDPRIFVRSGALCRIRRDEKGDCVISDMLKDAEFRGVLARVVNYKRVNKFNKLVQTSPPIDVVRDILYSVTKWPGIKPLSQIIESPVLRKDGSILKEPGYDDASGMYYHATEPPVIDIPVLSQEAAKDAASWLMTELFIDFPFVDEASKANALAALITPTLRPTIDGCVPFYVIDKPTPGMGASLLINVISLVQLGRQAEMAGKAHSDEEMTKIITSILKNSPAIVVLDNLTGVFGFASFSRMLTARIWSERLLGQSVQLALPQLACWYGTSNNVKFGGDLPRRKYWSRIDSKMARPQDRTGFLHPGLEAWTRRHRAEIVSKILTICAAWFAAGKPHVEATPMGSFEEWAS